MQIDENTFLEPLRQSLARARNPKSCALDAGGVIADCVENLGRAWPVLSSQQRTAAAMALVESPIFTRTKKFAQRRLAKLLQMNGSESKEYMLALAQILQAEPETTVQAAQEICQIIWRYRFTEPLIVTAYLELLAIAALHDAPIFKSGMDNQLLKFTLSCGSTKSSDNLREAAVHVFIALYSSPETVAAQQALCELKSQAQIAPQIMAAVVWCINRERDLTKRAAAAELCRAVLSDPVLCDTFYLNDLRVLVDVLLRDLDDLPETCGNLAEKLLATLCLAVGNPSLAAERYAAGRIAALLRSIRQTTNDETIRGLINNLCAMEWLCVPRETGADSGAGSSAESLSDSDPDSSSGSDAEIVSPFSAKHATVQRNTHRFASSVPSLLNQLPPLPEQPAQLQRPHSTPPVPAPRQRPRPPPPLPRIQSSTEHTKRPPPPPPRSNSLL